MNILPIARFASTATLWVLLAACFSTGPASDKISSNGTTGADEDGASSTAGDGLGPKSTDSEDGPEAATTSASTSPGPGTTSATSGDSGSEDGTPEATGAGDSDPDPTCPGTMSCAPLPPMGWSGPARLLALEGGGTPECPDSLPETLDRFGDDVVAPQAECDCTCSAEGASCPSSLPMRHGNNCGALTETRTLAANTFTPEGCTDIDFEGLPPQVTQVITPDIIGGTCTPRESEDIVPDYFDEQVVMCGPSRPAIDCSGEPGLCLEENELPTCIWAEGEQACPAESAFSERQIFYREIYDTRQCSECTCGGPSGDCTGTIYFYDGPLCGTIYGVADATRPVGPCGSPSIPSSTIVAAYLELEPEPTCSTNPGQPLGDAQPRSPVTACCIP